MHSPTAHETGDPDYSLPGSNRPRCIVTIKIYIVDDDAAVRSALSLLAHSVGWNPQSFPSAESFLQSYEPKAGGCLLLDLDMPGMGGADLCEWLQANDQSLPVVIVTAHQDTHLAARAMKAGAHTVMPKPVDGDALLDVITKLAVPPA